MLLGKEPSKFEVYNDIEGELVNFFRVVKNRPAELLLELDLLPLNSREEFAKTTEDGQNLSGWRFGIYSNSACTNLVSGPYSTNSSGKITVISPPAREWKESMTATAMPR